MLIIIAKGGKFRHSIATHFVVSQSISSKMDFELPQALTYSFRELMLMIDSWIV